MVELGSEFIWLWFLEKNANKHIGRFMQRVYNQAKYSTKNYVSNIVQPLLSLMSLRSKIQNLIIKKT
jgi:hypothetical protein